MYVLLSTSSPLSLIKWTSLTNDPVFSYTFVMPDDPGQKVHRVMWDYQIGLVRITAMFKAFEYAKV